MTHAQNNLILSMSLCSGIPVLLFDGDELLQEWGPKSFHPSPARHLMRDLPADAPISCWRISREFLLSGAIRMPGSNQLLIVGPVSNFMLSRSQSRRLLMAMHESVSRSDELIFWFDNLADCNKDRFLYTLRVLAALIYEGKEIIPTQLPLPNDDEPFPVYQRQEAPEDTSFTSEHEVALTSAVSHGDVDKARELIALLDHGSSNIPRLTKDAMHSFLVHCTVLLTIISRAAIRGGLNFNTAVTLQNHYLQLAARADEYENAWQVLIDATVDFTRRVADCQLPVVHSALVTQVDRYIRAHLDEPVRSSQIAEALHLNAAYLSRQFSQQVGMTITDYIHKVKINEAKRLLESTKLSTTDITALLGFSSQQYFNTIFRQLTGSSPKEYRMQCR